MQFHGQHKSPQHANDPLHLDNVGLVRGFFAPTLVLVTILVAVLLFIFASNYLPALVIMLIAIGVGVVCGLNVLKYVIRKREKYAAWTENDRRNAQKAETQKQIDAMQRANSRIPKVKR